MASLLFIENREKTRFWEQIALYLQQQGHEVAWLVQNPAFAPKLFAAGGHVRVLRFPRQAEMASACPDDAVIDAHPSLVTDRGRRYFGAGSAHYEHYTTQIRQCLEERRPDLVIGESTLFHELIAIAHCRANGIPYVHPTANRYPSGRFSLFALDTQLPALESGEIWPDAKARDLAERISSGREIPFYMRAPGRIEKAVKRARWAMTRGRVWFGRLQGERYNTPALWRKLALHRRLQINLRRWQQVQRLPAVAGRALLYPLQLQPEANIDVWGRPYSDQIALLRELLAAAPTDVQIAVKANPKAKYELSEALLHLADTEKRVCLLPLEMNMIQAHTHCVGAITVSGTVGFEAIFGKGRCLSLRHPLIEQEFGDFHAASPADAVHRLLHDPAAGVGGVTQGTRLIQRLVAQSFPGLVSDPLSHPSCMERPNVEAIARALNSLARTHREATASVLTARPQRGDMDLTAQAERTT